MLQQTQVATVIPYFLRFTDRFPNITALNNADEDAVMAHWSGLGYYSRARNIYKTAAIIAHQYQGVFPSCVELLQQLPGIGKTTAAAITSQAFNQPTAILDANVKRVLSRCFAIGSPLTSGQMTKKLWEIAEFCMPKIHCREYTQAIMDLGAMVCTHKNPQCQTCPLQRLCSAYHQEKIADYPYKPVKQKIPTRYEKFLLCHQKGHFFLEKRPPKGIWGGLWSLPSIDSQQDPIHFLNEKYHFTCIKNNLMATLTHSFSHFKLQIEVRIIEVTPKYQAFPEHTGQWFNASNFRNQGVSAPVKRIITQFLNLAGSI